MPIYLSFWDAQTYGVWLILLGMVGYLALISTAYQQYTYGEVLKCGPQDSEAVRTIYRTSLVIAVAIALIEFAAVAALAPVAAAAAIPDESVAGTASTVALIIVLFAMLNLATMPFGAITARTLTIYGHYPAMAAWSLLRTTSSLFLPAIAVAFGADLRTAGIVLIASHSVPATLALASWARLAKRQGLFEPTQLDWRMGMRNIVYCLPLAGRIFIDSFRQQGFRLVLGAYAGASAVTALATMRTFANVLHQGLTTITAPLMPELMRYVLNRDQDRMEGAFAIVWLSLFVFLVPGVLLLCLVAEPLFVFWTRGAVTFDPVLFLTLLVAVLIFAAGQPALAILQGRNRVAWQIGVSITGAACLGAFAVALVPPMGIRGAGFALLAAEIGAGALAVIGATRTLANLGLRFPLRCVALVVVNVAAVFILSLLAVTVFVDRPAVFAGVFAANLFFGALYWATIPAIARDRLRQVQIAIRTKL